MAPPITLHDKQYPETDSMHTSYYLIETWFNYLLSQITRYDRYNNNITRASYYITNHYIMGITQLRLIKLDTTH